MNLCSLLFDDNEIAVAEEQLAGAYVRTHCSSIDGVGSDGDAH